MLHAGWTPSYNYTSQLLTHAEEEHSFRVRFVLVVSISGLIGLVGNGLLLCFYGNRRTRTYRSRDAIYIRRQACADLLICAVVIPYSVLFESDLITSDRACKTMEFTRHFLIYLSHLLLYTYSWELPQRHVYSASKTYSLNTFLYSGLMSLLAAAPTIFIFKVDRKAVHQTHLHHHQYPAVRHHSPFAANRSLSTATIDKEDDVMSCRLITNLVPSTEEYDVKSLTWVYVILPILVYSMSLYWFLINLASYINTVDTTSRKDSIFLSKLEDVRLFRGSNLNVTIPGSSDGNYLPGSQINRKKKRRPLLFTLGQVRAKKIRVKEEDYGEERDSDEDDGTDVLERQENIGRAPGVNNNAKREETRMGKVPSIVINTGGQPLILSSEDSFIGSDEGGERVRGKREGGSKKTRFQTKIQIVELSRGTSDRIRKRRGTGAAPRAQDDSPPSSKGSNDQDNAAHIEIVEFDPGSKKKRPILSNSFKHRFYPQVGSYKKSLATLILLDLLIILVAMALFLVADANSVVLNVVHFKSIFTFYILSLLNPYLRNCVWGSDMCECLPEASDPRESTQEDGELKTRPSVLQVSFVRERYRQKRAVRRLRQQRRLQLIRDQGTEIS